MAFTLLFLDIEVWVMADFTSDICGSEATRPWDKGFHQLPTQNREAGSIRVEQGRQDSGMERNGEEWQHPMFLLNLAKNCLESNSYINIFSGLQRLSGMAYPICHFVRVTKSENMPSVVKTEQFKEALWFRAPHFFTDFCFPLDAGPLAHIF